jgi:type I restriction enzyme R subunit
MALQYFDEFQRVNKDLIARGEKPLAVAVTFSWSTDNSDGQLEKNEGLRRAINAYNLAFHTPYDDHSVSEYFANVSARLAGKVDGPKLDIVIVIDQLLTGFDAPMLNTLYVDRTLSGASLIQAYSRTNRIHDFRDKPWGRIVNYRWPETSKRLMDQALKVYSNRDSAMVQGEHDLEESGVLAEEFSAVVVQTRSIVNEISELTGSFKEIPPSESSQEHLLSAIQQYINKVAALKQYPDFDYSHPEELLDKLGITKEQDSWAVYTALNELKKSPVADKVLDLSDLNFRAEAVMEVRVNYDYLADLLAQLLNEVNEGSDEQADATLVKLNSAADQLEDRKFAEQVKDAAGAVRSGESRATSYPATSQDAGKLVRSHSEGAKRRDILQFKRQWGLVDIATANELINAMIERHIPNKDDLNVAGELMELTKEAADYYSTDAEDAEIQKLSKVKYRNQFREAFKVFADKISQKY